MSETNYTYTELSKAIKTFFDTSLNQHFTYPQLFTVPTIEEVLQGLNFKEIKDLLNIMNTVQISIKPNDSENYQQMSLADYLLILDDSGMVLISPKLIEVTQKAYDDIQTLVLDNTNDLKKMIATTKASISKTKSINSSKWDIVANDIQDKYENEKLADLQNKGDYTDLKVNQLTSFFEKSLGI